jgi:hypothetical protein
VFTDDQGRFMLPVPPLAAAPFTISVAKAGYAGATLRVSAADVDASRDVEVRLARGAAISGQVVDPNGDAVADALVLAQPVPPAAGVPAFQLLAETDDRGEYRLGGLPAGRYTVSVRGVPTTQRDALSALAARLQLNPDAPVPFAAASAAAAVELRAGAESTGVNLVLNAVPTSPSVPLPPTNLPPGQSGTGAIGGRVVSASGRPISGAIVRAMRPGMVVRLDQSDREGRFSIGNLPPGDFTLEARKDGYITVQYGQQRANESGKAVTVRDGETLERIDIVLPGGSVVAGTVVDDHGEPIAGASVAALQLRDAGDLTMAMPGGRARQTDDRGRYRLFGLLPGSYIISATLDGEVSSASRADATGYAPVFYPGTTEVARASQLQVAPGGDVSAIDLVFTRAPTARITGVAYHTDGRPWPAALLLFESQRTGNIMREPRKAVAAADGSFTFTNVPPGTYVVQALGATRAAAPRPPQSGGQPLVFGMAYVTVAEGDPAPVAVRTTAGSTIEGHIVKEGSSPDGRFGVYPFPTDFDQSPVIGFGLSGLTMLDGDRFRVTGMTGSRRFVLTSAPPGWYLKSATVNGADAAEAPFDFGQKEETYRDVEVVLSDRGATLSGRVTDDKGAAVNDYAAIVFSVDRAQWFRNSPRMKLARPSQTGAFTIDALPPGDYFAIAVDRAEGTPAAGEWQNPRVLDGWLPRASRLTVSEGEARTLTLRVINR